LQFNWIMKKIDSYILKKFLTTFFFCLLLFTAIVVVIDISEKADDFARIKLSAWAITTQYYLGFVPHIDAMLFPLFVFISVIFFTSKMAERSEVVAILSIGVSFRRFLFPYWLGSIFLGSILWFGYQYVLPRANEIWGSFQTKYIDSNAGDAYTKVSKENIYFRIDTNSYAGLKSYDTTIKQGYNFFIQKFANNQMVYDLRADNINWDTATRKWRLSRAVEHYFNGDKENILRKQTMLINYNFKPQDLRGDEYFKDRLPTPDLNAYIEKEKMRGSEMVSTLLVERYNRDAIPASVVILTIIAAVLSSRRIRGGSGFHLGIGVIISVLYILCSRFSIVFAEKGNFTPLLAAWTPNIIFGALAFYLYKQAPK
jgi:lipopolysaccharide export system permease protein